VTLPACAKEPWCQPQVARKYAFWQASVLFDGMQRDGMQRNCVVIANVSTTVRQHCCGPNTLILVMVALQGCGLVCFSSAAAAAAAKADLHDKYRWAPDHAPMVLERVNAKKKRSNISHEGELHSHLQHRLPSPWTP